MHKTTALLLWMAMWMPLAGAIHFCGLVVGASLGWIVLAAILAAAGLGYWISTICASDPSRPLSKNTGLLLLAGIAFLTAACAFLSRRYGDWDAALIWNLHARYLATGDGWRSIYEPGASGNAAYPMGLPSSIALLWRVLGSDNPTVPFFAALLPTLGIPVVIFLEGARGKFWVSLTVLPLFAFHRYYLALGLDQYADIQVAWPWLLAAVCMNRAHISRKTDYWFASGLLLGALCWTKWEGILLSVCLLAPWAAYFLRNRRALLLLLLGLTPFVLTITMFLRTGPPEAPLLTDLAGIATRMGNGERYRIIGRAFTNEVFGRHWPFATLLVATPILLQKWADRFAKRMYISVVGAVVGYAAVYLLLVSTDLEWNLQFSLARLLLQVYPVAVFAGSCAASLPIVVVLPTPFTPTTSNT